MDVVKFSLLRGICQTPAYVACQRGFFAAESIEPQVTVVPTAWLVPERLTSGATHFGVIPWTRVAASDPGEAPLRVVCGSGLEEAALVARVGLAPGDVRSVAVPREGGMKDLTAQGLLESLGWGQAEQRRYPSGDGAILAFVGRSVDAASMIEPYATMLVELGMGTIVRRTGDLWPGAPGCSLSTSAALIERQPDLVERVVRAYARAARFVLDNPEETAAIAEPYVGVHRDIIRSALRHNRPDVDAVRNAGAMDQVLRLMVRLGYVDRVPEGFLDLRFLDRAQGRSAS